MAQAMGADPKKLADRARELHEFNPMLGFRGCRLAIAYPEIAEMQARAIFEAAVEAGTRDRQAGRAGDHGAADRQQDGARSGQGAHRRHGGDGRRRDQAQDQLSGRHHDRAAARRAAGRRDRRDRGVLLLRHQRSDPDHVRHQPRRRRELSRHLHGEGHSAGRSVRLDRPRRRRRAGAHRRRARPQGAAASSSSASAASMAAIPPRSPSATRSGSTTCPARRSACRSRGSPPRRRRSARMRRRSSDFSPERR